MAAPTFRAAASVRGNSTTAAVTIPGTVQDGDWGVIVVANNDGMGAPSTPTGWSVVLATAAINAKQRVTVFAKKYAAGDANPSMTFAVASNWSTNAVWYSGSDGVGVVGSLTGSATGTTSTAAAVTTTSVDNLVLTIGTHFNGSLGFAASAALTPDAVVKSALYGAATFNHAIVIGEVTKAAAGATNTQTVTWDSAGSALGGLQVAFIATVPPQTWVPTTDTGSTITGWTKTPSGAAGVYAVLADTDSATYIESGDNPTSQPWISAPFAISVPADLTTVKVKVSGYLATGTTGSRLIQLYQGATLVKQATVSLTGVNVESTVSLTSTEAGSMTVTSGQWQNLTIRVADTAS